MVHVVSNMRKLSDILDDRNNSFNAVRLFAAAAVFVSHATLIVPIGTHSEPLDGTAYNLGQISVNVFFFLSGMMLSRSYSLKPQLASFIVARILRIFPALIACGFGTAWIVGALNTDLSISAYFTSPQTLSYPIRMLFQFNAAKLPGVFLFGLEPGEINVPLWTIKFELLAYAAFLLVPLFRLFGSKQFATLLLIFFAGLLITTTTTHIFDASFVVSIVRFGFCFALGMVAYLYRDNITSNWPLAIIGVIAATTAPSWPGDQVFSIMAFAYLAITLGATHIPFVSAATHRVDISYGLYLCAFPIQQALVAQYGTTIQTAALSSLGAALVAMSVATCSWHFIEKPALMLKNRRRTLITE